MRLSAHRSVGPSALCCVLACLLSAACGPRRPSSHPDVVAPGPGLSAGRACPGQAGFTCSTLRVPLDPGGREAGTVQLYVATADNVSAPRGVLLFLTGGPGQPGVPFIGRIAHERLPELLRDYRLVMIDQRGTGEGGALDCPPLQQEVGSSDIAEPQPAAVTACAQVLGSRAAFYGIDETVADLEALRVALGVAAMTLDGVSYGTFTAERYAIAHPQQVKRLVLDSVVPHHLTADDSLYLVALRGHAAVLQRACAVAPACGYDPAEDLAWVVRHRSVADGVRLFDMMVSYEFIDPTYRDPHPSPLGQAGDPVGALHAARRGDTEPLARLLNVLQPGGDPIASFSSGLHAAALCSDLRFAWGDSSVPVTSRKALLSKVIAGLPEAAVWPYTAQIAAAQGFTKTCLEWPVVPPSTDPSGALPDVPTLLLNGDADLSTPLQWAQAEAALAPHGTLVVVPGASHSIQTRERGHVGRDAVKALLLS
jgi:pimeloyl-ACP methyl ester carboxylesterase